MSKASKLAMEVIRQRDLGKHHYETADQALARLLETCDVGHTIILDDGRRVEIVDNFAVKNKVFKPCGISRLDIKVHEKPG